MPGTKLITAATAEPLLLADVKTRLSITDTIDDPDIASHIIAARQQAEAYLQRSLITQTWELALDFWPTSLSIPLPHGPVQSVTSVKYLDSASVEQTMVGADYDIDDYSQPPRLVRLADAWPALADKVNAVKIRYDAGFGDDGGGIPEDIKTAMLLAIGHWIRFQADAEQGIGPTRMPRQFYDLLERHRIMEFS